MVTYPATRATAQPSGHSKWKLLIIWLKDRITMRIPVPHPSFLARAITARSVDRAVR